MTDAEPIDMPEPTITGFVGEVGAGLLYLGLLFGVPTVLLATPIHLILSDVYVPMASEALGTGVAPLVRLFVFCVSIYAAFVAVKRVIAP
jgi:hypothetical protein